MRLGADVIGAIPHFEFTREYGVESLHKIFALAQNTTNLSTCTVTKSMMSNPALLKPLRHWHIATIWASA